MCIIPDALENHRKVLKLLRNQTRLQILYLLLAHGKLSHSELSTKLGRAKSTVTSHMQQLAQVGLVQSSAAPAQGSIDAKEYVLLTEKIAEILAPLRGQPKLGKRKKVEIERQLLAVIEAIWESALINYDRQPDSYGIDHVVTFLSAEEYQAYQSAVQHYQETRDSLKHSRTSAEVAPRSHVLIQAVFPISDLVEKKGFTTFRTALNGKKKGAES